MNPPLDILDYQVVEISVKPNLDFKPDLQSVPVFNVSTSTDSPSTKTAPMIRLTMTIKQQKKASSNQAYNLKLIIEGLFSYQQNIGREQLEELLRLNANSILYGLARAVVSQTTATMTNGKILLPTVNFYAARKKKGSQKKSHNRFIP